MNRGQFEVGYAVDQVGPSGIGSVDLYITENGGREWWKYGEDTDKTSPIAVQVPQDGEYGFVVRVRSGAGLSMEPPRPGDAPELTVTVDQTPPKLELLPIQQGSGLAGNQVTIRWRVGDPFLAPTPIALSYAKEASGPWTKFAEPESGVEHYRWSITEDLPSKLYVRVEARDLAGNMSSADVAEPIVVDLSRPQGRIVDVAVPHLDGRR